MFAEMLVQARGYGDADEIAKTMSLVDIIYEMKKEELKKEAPPPEVKKPEPEPEPVVEVKKAEETEEEEPIVIVKIKDFWSRLTHDSDTE
jgi:outer membrane biosynthesis protein TonB